MLSASYANGPSDSFYMALYFVPHDPIQSSVAHDPRTGNRSAD